ncbi:hypothetical protein ACHWQZ_G015394 [Mnemiopsis leidyi]
MATDKPKVDGVFRTRSLGIAASGVQDQYSDGKAAKVWHLYIGGKKRTNEYKEKMVNLLKEHGVQTVLDAACGTGVDSVMLLEAGFTVKSVDASDKMLKYAYKLRWQRHKNNPLYDDWEIGEGDWLDLENCEDTITHPEGGYDAVICIGNSFAHLPDFAGDNSLHKLAISNFHKMLKPGGILIIDHRNYDHIIKYGALPNSSSKLYYQGDRIHKIKTSVLTVDREATMVTLDYEIDISGIPFGKDQTMRTKPDGSVIPVSQFRLSYYPHLLDNFTGMLKGIFGEGAEHQTYSDFQSDPPADYISSYYIHVIKKQ